MLDFRHVASFTLTIKPKGSLCEDTILEQLLRLRTAKEASANVRFEWKADYRRARETCGGAGRFGPMVSSKQDRAERRERHSREVEASQKALRASISETERLVGESEEMLRRHREERED